MPCLSRINPEGCDWVYFVRQFCYLYFKLFIHSHLFQYGSQLSRQRQKQTNKQTNKEGDFIVSGANNDTLV